jgi:hypothetical protein
MKDLLDKLSSYNVFNYLLPGVIFVAIADAFTSVKLIQENLIVGVFVYYFIGSVISRIGSLLIEPALKKMSFIKFVPYSEFVSAAKLDAKLEILSETNNMYRTFVAMLAVIALMKVYDLISLVYPSIAGYAPYCVVVTLLILYLFSYRKQTLYITKRIEKNRDTPQNSQNL